MKIFHVLYSAPPLVPFAIGVSIGNSRACTTWPKAWRSDNKIVWICWIRENSCIEGGCCCNFYRERGLRKVSFFFLFFSFFFPFFFLFFSSPFLICRSVLAPFFIFFFLLIMLVTSRKRERANYKYDLFISSCAKTAVEMLARLRSGYSLDSEYLRVQDRFRLEDGVFVLLEEEKQQQQQQGSSQRRTSTSTTSRTVPDAPTQEAIQREYLELIKWSNMPIDPQLLGEKGQQQQQQQRKDQQEQRQQERHEQPEQQQKPG